MGGPIVWWFRRDLRLADQPVLEAAACQGRPVVPLYVHAAGADEWGRAGAASRWWLHHSLQALDQSLRARGSRLIVRRGDPARHVADVAVSTGATSVCWNGLPEPAERAAEERVRVALARAGVQTVAGQTALLHDPDDVCTAAGGPYRVFTPFWQACLARGAPRRPAGTPGRLAGPGRWPASDSLSGLRLEPRGDWTAGLRAVWTPGEAGAQARLQAFASGALSGYAASRDRLGEELTSRLSPHLHFGELTPAQVWARAGGQAAAAAFLRQLGWREFAHHLLWHLPQTVSQPLRPEFAAFPWADAPAALQAWQRGLTGYPLVDAGMRQLWATGWMHNRARLVAASFLVKDLLLPWLAGARWFWDTLVDADLANNTLGWQWSAGSGADAAPYFRILNPVLQGERYDPSGAYVRRWVPALARLPDRFVHRPWEAPERIRVAAGLRLEADYPLPLIDHGFARQRALQAWRQLPRGPRVALGPGAVGAGAATGGGRPASPPPRLGNRSEST